MATLNRRPLATRSLQHPSNVSPFKHLRTASGSKRPRSPEPSADPHLAPSNSKRVKAAIDPSPASKARDAKARERKYVEREQQKAEFKEKYTRAFPGFTFYFDELNMGHAVLEDYEERIEELGGSIVKFLDKAVTHFISNRPDATLFGPGDKENHSKSGLSLKSPIKLKGKVVEETQGVNGLPPPLDYKVWNTTKLESVLERLVDQRTASASITPTTAKKQAPSLARLLKSEQIHGTTERDPTQKRYDFKYFTRGSKFVLIEDLRQELATIAAHEYPVHKAREARIPWPVLYCHPQARGPFIPFDEKEKRRWEKLQRAEGEQKAERKEYSKRVRQAEVIKRKAESHAKRAGDLRRSVSMNNLRRAAQEEECFVDLDGDGDNLDSANASGYLASGATGYMAASGNSVNITSNTGTTSTAAYPTRAFQHTSSVNARAKYVTTSRRFPIAAYKENKGPMGPPTAIPERQPMLRKSRSTNTLKLPKREEGSKPGYCESCRIKFDDFKAHIVGRKHQRFATNDANFLQLDCVLSRVRRRTKQEVLETAKLREEGHRRHCRGFTQPPLHPECPSPALARQPSWFDTSDVDSEMQAAL